MAAARTTRCCSAIALILLAAASRAAAAGPPPPLPFVPTRVVWSLPLNNAVTGPPAYDGTRAFIPIAGDRLVAYDLKTGTLTWTVSAAPALPLAAGDGLVFLVEKDALVARHQSDGSRSWRAPLEFALAVPPVYDNGWLILAGTTGTIVALSAKDSRVIWRHEIGVPPHARPALSADRVYVPAANAHVIALRVETGDQIWDRRLGGDPNDILALDDRLYLGAKDKYLYCIDSASGIVEWRSMRTGSDVVGLPAYDDDTVYFVSLDNVVRAVSRRSGVQRWMKQLPLRPSGGPLRAGGTIIVPGAAASLPTFNAKDGTPVGSLPAAPELAALPYVLDDPRNPLPTVAILTKDLAKGLAATVSLLTRGLDPAPAPVGALPGAITILPSGSPTASAEPRAQTRD